MLTTLATLIGGLGPLALAGGPLGIAIAWLGSMAANKTVKLVAILIGLALLVSVSVGLTIHIQHLERDGRTSWEGVRNYQARNFMRDEMEVGDPVLFYHSNTEPIGVAGVARVARTAYPDATALDPFWVEQQPAHLSVAVGIPDPHGLPVGRGIAQDGEGGGRVGARQRRSLAVGELLAVVCRGLLARAKRADEAGDQVVIDHVGGHRGTAGARRGPPP